MVGSALIKIDITGDGPRLAEGPCEKIPEPENRKIVYTVTD